MSTQSAASYLPDSQVITLKPEFDVFADLDAPQGLQTAEQIGFFFHEWIHYLHNVSTIQGLSAYANLVGLWSAFRRTIGADGLSDGVSGVSEAWQLSLRQKAAFLSATRRRKANNLDHLLRLDEMEFLSVNAILEPIEASDIVMVTISCEVRFLRSDPSNQTTQLIKVGNHEILECAAFMLEDRLTLALGGIAPRPSVDPYFLAKGVAHRIAPSLSDDDVLLCLLLSLQNTDPAAVLLDILAAVEAAARAGESPTRLIAAMAQQDVTASTEFVDETLRQLEGDFPVDEPMSRAIKSTVQTMRTNFAYRRAAPLLELGIIGVLKSSTPDLKALMSALGTCTVLQQRYGPPDAINRDLMIEFVLDVERDDALTVGWQTAHAGFRFVNLHVANGVIVRTASLVGNPNVKCPFYTVCDYPFRHARPDDCKSAPWLARHSSLDELCWYGNAVRLLKPPAGQGKTQSSTPSA